MKNSNFIKIFVITFICFFSLNFKVKGADCTYSLTIDGESWEYQVALQKALVEAGAQPNGIRNLEKELFKYKQYENYDDLFLKRVTLDLLLDDGSFEMTFVSSLRSSTSTSGGTSSTGTDVSYVVKGTFDKEFNSCPAAAFISFYLIDGVKEEYNIKMTQDEPLNLEDYLNSGQTIIGYLNSQQGTFWSQIVLPLTNTYNGSTYRDSIYKIDEYFEGFVCTKLVSGDRRIYDIFDDYRYSGFDYEQIYKNGGDKQSISELIKNSILKLPYFSYSTKEDATYAIEEDLAILEQYNNSVVTCLEDKVSTKNWGTTGVNSSDDWFKKYEPKNVEPLYVNMMISILKQVLENDLYDIAADMNEELDVKFFIESQCPQDQNIKNICLDGVCENFSKIKCDYIKRSLTGDSIAGDVTQGLTNDEDKVATYISQVCDRDDVDCQNNYCNQFKNQCSNIVNNNTETQKKYDEIMNSITKDIIDQVGYEINDICDLLYDEDKGIGIYFYGLLDAIKIVGPILVIILTGLDAMKMIASGKEDEQKKFFNRLKIRLICLALLFLIPSIIEFLVKIVIEDKICNIRYK